jgi:hypothetical protein
VTDEKIASRGQLDLREHIATPNAYVRHSAKRLKEQSSR